MLEVLFGKATTPSCSTTMYGRSHQGNSDKHGGPKTKSLLGRNRSAQLREAFQATEDNGQSSTTLSGLFWRLLKCNAIYLVSSTVLAIIASLLTICDAVLLRYASGHEKLVCYWLKPPYLNV